MKPTHVILGCSLLLLSACGGGGGGTTTPPVNIPAQVLASIRLGATTIALSAGSVQVLTVEALDASGRVIPNVTGYSFASSATNVAELQSGGGVLGISAGSAVVTVSLTRDGVTATGSATVTVTGSLPVAATVTAGNADQTFTPPTVIVARNASVTFDFGALQHNVTFRVASGAPASVPSSTNASIARSFPSAGDFRYDCSLHAGMTGAVIVR
ncbi:MAG: hypothetical protein H7099_06370 [Gemmatimonadaceae bacterium]|nr:hypothetical protein [Gemmatimonadaceae bacterium]